MKPLLVLILILSFIVSQYGWSQVKVKQQKPLIRILFIFDASNSMQAKYNELPRIDNAKKVFVDFIDTLSKKTNIEFALRALGHTVQYPPGDCKDTKLLVPFSKNNLNQIKTAIATLKPTGTTPLEHALTESAKDFPDNKAINTVILITDGVEECSGDPCKAKQALFDKGVVLKPFIIGIGLTNEQIKSFDCFNNFYNYDSIVEVLSIQKIISNQDLNKTTAQVNLMDFYGLPSETNIDQTFYNNYTNSYVYNYIHTFNHLQNSDTLYIDKNINYRVVAHTIPPQEVTNVELYSGKHTIIPIKTPQGFIEIKTPQGLYNNELLKTVIKKCETPSVTIHVQQINTTEKYITDNYCLEILTLPRILVKSVIVTQSSTQIIEIESAGLLKINAGWQGDGCILKDNKKLDWVCNLTTQMQQNYNLQPGNYRLEWRSKKLKGSIYTIEKKFKIFSDQITTIDLYK